MERINLVGLSAVVNPSTELLIKGDDGKKVGIVLVPKAYNKITLEFLQEFITALGTLQMSGLESSIIIIQNPILKLLLNNLLTCLDYTAVSSEVSYLCERFINNCTAIDSNEITDYALYMDEPQILLDFLKKNNKNTKRICESYLKEVAGIENSDDIEHDVCITSEDGANISFTSWYIRQLGNELL